MNGRSEDFDQICKDASAQRDPEKKAPLLRKIGDILKRWGTLPERNECVAANFPTFLSEQSDLPFRINPYEDCLEIVSQMQRDLRREQRAEIVRSA